MIKYHPEHRVEVALLRIRRQQLTIFVTDWYAGVGVAPLIFFATH